MWVLTDGIEPQVFIKSERTDTANKPKTGHQMLKLHEKPTNIS